MSAHKHDDSATLWNISHCEVYLEDAVGSQTHEAHDTPSKSRDVVICACKGWHLHANHGRLSKAYGCQQHSSFTSEAVLMRIERDSTALQFWPARLPLILDYSFDTSSIPLQDMATPVAGPMLQELTACSLWWSTLPGCDTLLSGLGPGTWMMAYRRTEAAMMRAPLGVKLSVVTPVPNRLHLRVSLLLIATPCKADAFTGLPPCLLPLPQAACAACQVWTTPQGMDTDFCLHASLRHLSHKSLGDKRCANPNVKLQERTCASL